MGTSAATGIRVKGIREGILLGVDDGDTSYDEVMQALRGEVAEKKTFLNGSRIVLDVGNRLLERAQLAEIQDFLADNGLELWAVLAEPESTKDVARQLGLATRLPGSNTDLDGKELSATDPSDFPAAAEQSTSNAVLLKETIRSGQSVYHEGHVVIVGDVNPGAEIVAGGNVVVWGRLRGLVHAGARGEAGAVICALRLTPTQLRIADQIAIPPDEEERTLRPEMASIREGQIVADPWRLRLEN